MKQLLIFCFCLSAFFAQAQFSTITAGRPAFAVLGQSNARGFGESVYGAKALATLLKTYLGVDTVLSASFGSNGTYLANTVGNDWNAASVGEFTDSILFKINGYPHPSVAYNITTGQTPGLGNHRRNGVAAKVRWVLWIQGENDSTQPTTANAYEANLTAWVAKVRRQFNDPTLKFIFVQLGAPYTTGAYKSTINTAMANVASADANADVIDTSDMLSSDYIEATPVHYNTTGLGKLATKISTKIQANGW